MFEKPNMQCPSIQGFCHNSDTWVRPQGDLQRLEERGTYSSGQTPVALTAIRRQGHTQ